MDYGTLARRLQSRPLRASFAVERRRRRVAGSLIPEAPALIWRTHPMALYRRHPVTGRCPAVIVRSFVRAITVCSSSTTPSPDEFGTGVRSYLHPSRGA